MTPEGKQAIADAAALNGVANPVEAAEATIAGDDRLVKVILKIRDKIAEVSTAHDAVLADLKAQKHEVEVELLRRLQERGATSTKTQYGTSYISEKAQYTIADAETFSAFVLNQGNTEFYQARAKVETVKAYMEQNGGQMPPGLNVFRTLEINTMAPKRKTTRGESSDE